MVTSNFATFFLKEIPEMFCVGEVPVSHLDIHITPCLLENGPKTGVAKTSPEADEVSDIATNGLVQF